MGALAGRAFCGQRLRIKWARPHESPPPLPPAAELGGEMGMALAAHTVAPGHPHMLPPPYGLAPPLPGLSADAATGVVGSAPHQAMGAFAVDPSVALQPMNGMLPMGSMAPGATQCAVAAVAAAHAHAHRAHQLAHAHAAVHQAAYSAVPVMPAMSMPAMAGAPYVVGAPMLAAEGSAAAAAARLRRAGQSLPLASAGAEPGAPYCPPHRRSADRAAADNTPQPPVGTAAEGEPMCTAVSGGEPPSAKRALSLDAAVTREPLSPSAAAGAASAEVEMGVARYDDCVCAWVQASACPAAATHICNLPSEV